MSQTTKRAPLYAMLGSLVAIVGCQTAHPPIRTASYVDLDRFAGDWYVIASIPTFIEKNAFNAVESYAPPSDGRIATTFTFSEGAFDGPRKVYRPTGFVGDDGSNAIWGMQFIWPFKAEYRIVYVDDAYEQTIIGRTKRDYAWIMARTPEISASDYADHLQLLAAEGYDTSKLRRVPQQTD